MGAVNIYVNGKQIQRIYRGGVIVWEKPELLSLPYDIYLDIVDDTAGSYGTAIPLLLLDCDALVDVITEGVKNALAVPLSLGNADSLCEVGVDGYSYGTALFLVAVRHKADHKVYLDEIATGLAAPVPVKVLSSFLDFKVYVTEAATATAALARMIANYYNCSTQTNSLGTGVAAVAVESDHYSDHLLYVSHASTGIAAGSIQVAHTSGQLVSVSAGATGIGALALLASRYAHTRAFSTHESNGIAAACAFGIRIATEEIVRIVEGGPAAYAVTFLSAKYENIPVPTEGECFLHSAAGVVLLHDVLNDLAGKTEGGVLPVPVTSADHEADETPPEGEQNITGLVVVDTPLDVNEPSDVEADNNAAAHNAAAGDTDASEPFSLEELVNLHVIQLVSVAADNACNVSVESFAALSNEGEEPEESWYDPVQTGSNLYIRSAWLFWNDGSKGYIDADIWYEVIREGSNLYIRSVDSSYQDREQVFIDLSLWLSPVQDGENLHIRSAGSVWTDGDSANIDTAFYLDPVQDGTDLHIRSAASIGEYLTKE